MVSTISRHPSRIPAGQPTYWTAASGAWIYSQSRSLIDWNQGLGAVGVLGHRYSDVLEAIGLGLRRCGVAHVPHREEAEVGELLISSLPYVNYQDWKVRFAQNGTDVTAAAIRLARAATNRDKIVVFEGAYHGESATDWHLCSKPPHLGIPSCYPKELYPIELPWNRDADFYNTKLKGHWSDIAAVIFEVNIDDPSEEMVRWLNELRFHDILLIADEVVTGFRFALGGACEVFNIRPDLVCFGKTLGNGLIPISALCGRSALMELFEPDRSDGYVFCSYTYSGYLAGLMAAQATLRALRDRTIFDFVESVGSDLIQSFNELADRHSVPARAMGQSERSRFIFANAGGWEGKELWSFFISKMAKQDIAMYVANFPTIYHSAEIFDRTERAMSKALEATGKLILEGKSSDG